MLTSQILERLGIDGDLTIGELESTKQQTSEDAIANDSKDNDGTLPAQSEQKSLVEPPKIPKDDNEPVLPAATSDEDLRALKKTADEILDTIKTEIRHSNNPGGLQPIVPDTIDLKSDLLHIMDTFGF
jgi:hypothetical protein